MGATPSPARGSPGTGCLRGGTQPWTLTDMTFLKFVAIYVSSSRSFCTLPNFALPSAHRSFDVVPPSLYLLFRFDFSAGLVPLLSRFARLWPTSLSLSLSFLAPSSSCPPPVLLPRASILFFPLQTWSLRSLRRREAPLPFHHATLVLLFPVGLLAAPFSSAQHRGSSFTCCSRVILQIERSVQIDFVPGYVLDFNLILRERGENSPSF